MGTLEGSPHSLQWLAQQGDLAAIAQLLQYITAAIPATITVARQGQTLQVYLSDAPQGTLDSCALVLYPAIYALGIQGIAQLTVLEGPPQENRQHWQQTFTLTSAAVSIEAERSPAATHPDPGAATAPGPIVLPDYIYCTEPLLASVFSPETEAFDQSASPLRVALPSFPWLKRLGQPWANQPPWQRWTVVMALSFLMGASLAQWRDGLRPTLAGATALPDVSQSSASSSETAISSAVSPPASPGSSGVQPSAQTTTVLAPGPTVTIKAVGDIIMGTDYQRYRMPDDWQYFFDGVKPALQEADLVFGNFESTLTEVPHSAKDTRRPMTFAFRSPPWYASVLRAAGFDVLSVANNHSMDFFEQGFSDTIANIKAEGMLAVGRKGDIQYITVNGIKLAFIGFSYLSAHNTVHDLDTAGALVREAEQNADVVVISVHAGKEGTDAIYSRNQEEFFYSENRGNLVHFSRTVVDYGADLVLGHGPHVPRAVELYSNRLIAYSLGNFLGYRTLSTQGPLGISMILQVGLDGDGNFVNGRIIPVALDPNGVPYVDNHFGSVILVRHATRRDFPHTPLVIDDLGNILRKE